MADKYISLQNGVDTEVEATVIGGTAAQAGDIPALDGSGRLDESLMPVGLGADVLTANAAEGISTGAFVYINSTGEVANASAAVSGTPAIGFVLETFTTGQPATVYFEGQNTGLTGLTVGARYYLSDATAGGVTTTPVSGTGKKHQFLGVAVTSTTISTEISDHIVLA